MLAVIDSLSPSQIVVSFPNFSSPDFFTITIKLSTFSSTE